MSNSAQDAVPTPSSTSFDLDCKQGYFQRRLRHLTSIQIRNLTPFPVRDAFASALSQPATHSQFTPLGNLSDDLDVTLLRRRSRRISTTSVNTLKNVTVEDVTGVSDEMRGSGEARGRRRTQSRVAFPAGVNGRLSSGAGPVLSCPLGATTCPPATRQSRIRTNPTASSYGHSASLPSVAPSSSVSTIPVSTLYFDHSQRTLERVVMSRLVETFITIFVPELPPLSPSPPSVNGKSRSRADSGPSPAPVTSATPSNVSAQATRRGARTSRSASIGTAKTFSTTTSHITSRFSLSKGKAQHMARQASSGVKTHRASSSVPLKKSSSHQSPLPSSSEAYVLPKVPNYISPIHRPSTNPLYSLDASSQSEFSEHTNLSSDRLRIQLWAKIDLNAQHLGNAKGKQKESDDTAGGSGSPRWKVLEEWDFSLSDLLPLSPELENHPSQLPSNTLVMTFLPTGHSFHLPPPSWSRSRSQSRSPSPSGYNTDPESEGRKLIQSTQLIPHEIPRGSQSLLGISRRSRKLEARSANFEELSQLVMLQGSIRDTGESLHDIISEIDLGLAKDHVSILKREASERQARIEDRQAETRAIIEGSNRLRDNLATRRMQIYTRREGITKAKALQVQEINALAGQKGEVAEERNNLITVRNRIPPIRTSLISTLAAIYPIELLSPSELLFTILAVPLPIPLNSHEPAPPLSLLSHKEVTEDSVATALGYGAHLVQLLSVYMGKGLVYPITYIGSRSLIRDNISAMVGPRMFPLFSRGVDTYRFEYAVFLLNKDIEMLMADRDLRALDMRHTLANLKNLLLTLTDGECASIRDSRYQDSPSTVGLTTPPRAASPSRASETPKGGRSPCLSAAELPLDAAASSGATTPKAGQSEVSTLSRYSKLSLGFPPLPGFFRSRSSPTTLQPMAKSATDTSEGSAFVDVPSITLEGTESSRTGKAEDDDDRHTIKGVIVGTTEQGAAPEVKQGGGAASAEEKISDATTLSSVSTVPVGVDSF